MTQYKNVPIATRIKNIKENSKRKLPWFNTEFCCFNGACAIVGGAPSVKDRIDRIKELSEHMPIFAVNGAHDFLVENDIKPNFFVMLDAKANNDFATKPQKNCVYLLASQCNKKIFEKLKDYMIAVWHVDEPFFPEHEIIKISRKRGENYHLVSAKGTVSMTTIALAYTMGFEQYHLFGMDSSFNDYQHAYEQKQNEKDEIVDFEIRGKKFKTTKALLNQMWTFCHIKELMDKRGYNIIIESEGLIKEVNDGFARGSKDDYQWIRES